MSTHRRRVQRQYIFDSKKKKYKQKIFSTTPASDLRMRDCAQTQASRAQTFIYTLTKHFFVSQAQKYLGLFQKNQKNKHLCIFPTIPFVRWISAWHDNNLLSLRVVFFMLIKNYQLFFPPQKTIFLVWWNLKLKKDELKEHSQQWSLKTTLLILDKWRRTQLIRDFSKSYLYVSKKKKKKVQALMSKIFFHALSFFLV